LPTYTHARTHTHTHTHTHHRSSAIIIKKCIPISN
jgi:hypothetical protein